MGKFPLLKIYRVILWFAAGLLFFVPLLVGFFSLITPGRSGYYARPDLLSTIVLILPFWGIALGTGIVAEIITLFLRMEDHLDELKQEQRQTNRVLSNVSPSTGSNVSGNLSPAHSQSPTVATTPNTLNPPDASVTLTSLTVTVEADSAPVYEQPSEHAKLLGVVSRGRVLKVYGRDFFGQWVCGGEAATIWVRVADLSISGDITALPVLAPLN